MAQRWSRQATTFLLRTTRTRPAMNEQLLQLNTTTYDGDLEARSTKRIRASNDAFIACSQAIMALPRDEDRIRLINGLHKQIELFVSAKALAVSYGAVQNTEGV